MPLVARLRLPSQHQEPPLLRPLGCEGCTLKTKPERLARRRDLVVPLVARLGSPPPLRVLLLPVLEPAEEKAVRDTEQQDLLAYEAPAGYICDPAREPKGALWSMIGPSSFQTLDQAHAVTKSMVTGLEIHRYGSLSANGAKGPMRRSHNFWAMLTDLP